MSSNFYKHIARIDKALYKLSVDYIRISHLQ